MSNINFKNNLQYSIKSYIYKNQVNDVINYLKYFTIIYLKNYNMILITNVQLFIMFDIMKQ